MKRWRTLAFAALAVALTALGWHQDHRRSEAQLSLAQRRVVLLQAGNIPDNAVLLTVARSEEWLKKLERSR